MSGTVAGGLKAKKTIMERHGSDWYKKIGRIGGRNGHDGGFASPYVGKDGLTGAQRAQLAGSKGGKISKRGKARKNVVQEEEE